VDAAGGTGGSLGGSGGSTGGVDAGGTGDAGETCDPLKQDCTEPDTKCSAYQASETAPLKWTCQPAGSAQSGDSCTGSHDTPPPWPPDECAAGLWCTVVPFQEPSGTCRKFCDKTEECGASEFCLQGPGVGLCNPVCHLFENDCAQGSWCAPAPFLPQFDPTLGFCKKPGTVPIGGACTFKDCVEGSVCKFGSTPGTLGVCLPECNATHPCAEGTCNVPSYACVPANWDGGTFTPPDGGVADANAD
jgi:hypothetical protein